MKSYKQFQISTRNSGRYRTIQVCVYESVKEMREAGAEYNSSSVEEMGKVWGLCQAYYKERLDGKHWVKSPEAGYIRLVKDACRTGIIAHEATHMAVAIYQQDIQRTIPDMDREERLAYLVGDITSEIVKGLYKYKLIPA